MSVVIGIVIAFALLLAYVRAVEWIKEARKTRFAFEVRDTYLFLRLDRPLGGDELALVTMRVLREALRLRLAGVGHDRLLVEASALRIANQRAFWLLIGALGPALQNEKVKLAVVCGRRTSAGRRFRESGILTPFPSVRAGEHYLRSAEPPQPVHLDSEQLDALLVSRPRQAA
ncbi:MAG TPA: hypothetical protein VGK93_07305 [Candidatus Eisenbacteria bacterium]